MAVHFGEDEAKQLVETLKQMGVKPRADNPQDLKAWMASYEAAAADQSADHQIQKVKKRKKN